MDDLTPVDGPPTPFEGRSAKVLGLIVIALLIALIKPWGSGSGPVAPPTAIASATAPPVVIAASPTPFDTFANYDHEIDTTATEPTALAAEVVDAWCRRSPAGVLSLPPS